MQEEPLGENEIDAAPTKSFFIDMLTRDIPLDQAILDLVDNSVDGAKALRANDDSKFDNLWVKLVFDENAFTISDNCGGFSKHAAKTYAFKFGRPDTAERTPHSIGQFGVGMKRALFKFGRHFVVKSTTATESWRVEVPVTEWETQKGWLFPITDVDADDPDYLEETGTQITVTELRKEVASRFLLKSFSNTIFELIKSKHRQFIADGLSISVNGRFVDATSLNLLVNDGLKPGRDHLIFQHGDKSPVKVDIIVAVGPSSPKQAGWYVVCNGRVILEADRTSITGWGLLEEAANRTVIPSYHNQFARFRGIVFFDSEDSSQVPWNTTKTNVDQDNAFWQATFARMTEMMRPVIDFLNDLDADIDEHTKDESPLHKFVAKSSWVSPERVDRKSHAFSAPARSTFVKGPKTVKIQYSRPVEDVDLLQDTLGVNSAKAVGEATFDSELKRQKRS